jgi:hypothetical protein
MEAENMEVPRKWFLAPALLLPLLFVTGIKANEDEEPTFRWDIVHISSFSPVTVNAGGSASALSNDCATVMMVTTCAKITVTGSGTFTTGDPDNESGGGNWQTFDKTGASTGSGRYKVTHLLRFTMAPGAQTSTLVDNIGDGTLTDNRAGLAFLSVKYFDNSGNPISGVDGKGVLVVSCHLNGNPPPQGPTRRRPRSSRGSRRRRVSWTTGTGWLPWVASTGTAHYSMSSPRNSETSSEPLRREGAEPRFPRLEQKRMNSHEARWQMGRSLIARKMI